MLVLRVCVRLHGEAVGPLTVHAQTTMCKWHVAFLPQVLSGSVEKVLQFNNQNESLAARSGSPKLKTANKATSDAPRVAYHTPDNPRVVAHRYASTHS